MRYALPPNPSSGKLYVAGGSPAELRPNRTHPVSLPSLKSSDCAMARGNIPRPINRAAKTDAGLTISVERRENEIFKDGDKNLDGFITEPSGFARRYPGCTPQFYQPKQEIQHIWKHGCPRQMLSQPSSRESACPR